LTGLGSLLGFAGNEGSGADETVTFDDISTISGSSSTDTLTGLNAPATWYIAQPLSRYVAGNTLYFRSIENLSGSAFDDTFVFEKGASLGGAIDGKSGNDTLDFSALTTDLYVDLQSGVACSSYLCGGPGVVNYLPGGMHNIANVFGGQNINWLVGDANPNILKGGAGTNYISGMGGDDVVYAGTGSNYLDGGDGFDSAYIPYQITCPAGNCVLTNFENIIFLQKPPVPPIYWEEQAVTKVTNILPVRLIPVTSQQIVSIICDGCSGIILRLPEGNQVDFGCGLGTRASLTEIYYDDLPGVLPDGYGLIFGMQPTVYQSDQSLAQVRGSVVVSFIVPEWLNALDYSILFWDKTAGNGQGGWVVVPSYRIAGQAQAGQNDRVEAAVSQMGVYVLATRGRSGSLTCSDTLTLALPDGDQLVVDCTSGNEAWLLPDVRWNLPDLPDGEAYLAGLTAGVYQNGAVAANQKMTVSFAVPEFAAKAALGMRYWDTARKTWVTVAGQLMGNRYEAEVSQAGTYVLVMVPEIMPLACTTASHTVPVGQVVVQLDCQDGADVVLWQELDSTLPQALPFEGRLVAGLTVQSPSGLPFTLSFSVPGGYGSLTLELLRADPVSGWVVVGDVLPVSGRVSERVTQGGTYALIAAASTP
jgi:hypothetical protein